MNKYLICCKKKHSILFDVHSQSNKCFQFVHNLVNEQLVSLSISKSRDEKQLSRVNENTKMSDACRNAQICNSHNFMCLSNLQFHRI